MPAIVLGAAGQLGRELVRAFPEAVAIDRTCCDLEDEGALWSMLTRMAPSCLLNGAAYTDVDGAEVEVERAYRVNTIVPGVLADYALRHRIPLVHYSTDYVFDGRKNGRYVESDLPRPLNTYGASKHAGEEAVCTRSSLGGGKYYLLRTSWLYGPTNGPGGNFIKTILRMAEQRDTLHVVADQYGTPTSARWLACVTRDLLAAQPEAPAGIYHAVPNGEVTWHGLAAFAISEAMTRGMPVRVLPQNIKAVETWQFPRRAVRPTNSRLDNAKLALALRATSFPAWQTQVGEYIAELHSLLCS